MIFLLIVSYVDINLYNIQFIGKALDKGKKDKNAIDYAKGIPQNWQKEGKEEVKSGSTGQNNAEGQGKFSGFKLPPPKCDGDIDTSDVI